MLLCTKQIPGSFIMLRCENLAACSKGYRSDGIIVFDNSSDIDSDTYTRYGPQDSDLHIDSANKMNIEASISQIVMLLRTLNSNTPPRARGIA